jgi:hypothetical protein
MRKAGSFAAPLIALALVSGAALGQPPAGKAQTGVPGAPYAGAPRSDGAVDAKTTGMSCEAMMADASTAMSAVRDSARKMMAQREIDQAKSATARGDEAGCKAHMQTAMNGLR